MRDAGPTLTTPLAIAMVGDATSPGVASGTPYFALTHAARAGLPVRGLRLDASGRRWARRRLLWNARRMITTGQRGGFQYSDAFLDRLWALDPPSAGEDLLNMFQLFPQRIAKAHEGRLFFYIDQTLTQMFATYALGLPDRVMADAVARERAQYHRAACVLTQSVYAARSVVEEYGVPAERVHAVVCGANLSPETLAARDGPALDHAGAAGRCSDSVPDRAPGPLRLVFVGKDWERKGLDRLVDGLLAARQRGAELTLRVIGVARSDVPEAIGQVPGIDWAGFVDKRRDERRFIDLVAGCDVGCLLSRAEAGGMSLREFCRLGLVTVAPQVGGAPEYVLPETTHLIGPEDDAAAIGDILYSLATDTALLGRQRQAAWAARASAGWDAPVRQIAEHIAHA